ncbi:MAG TPA: pseudouridine synthase [Candidatus Saccharimonadales bacterium]|nr:pseudouridine synthase [Candidatus Saccharimonadales bacterium]
MRLNKFLAHAGVASRRKVDLQIEEGKVLVNNKKAVLGQRIDPEKDKIIVNGKEITTKENLEYFILNKPVGVTSTVSDSHAKKTVLDIVKVKSRVYPVGRLDLNSKGLILLTNDGDLANRLTHPRYHVPKVYQVLYIGSITGEKIGRIEKGIELEEPARNASHSDAGGGKTKEAKVKTITNDGNKTLLEITLYEGRKRQIRRMAEKLHLHIISLKRMAIGPIQLGDLESGKFRSLSAQEIKDLKNAASV